MNYDYPTHLDEIDKWLRDTFGILPGCCASTEQLRHSTARMVAEALWPKELPSELEEAAFAYENQLWESGLKDCGYSPKEVNEAFIAGAKWQAERDQEIIEVAEDHAMLAGMNKMKEEMMEKAVEGIVQDDGQFINFGDGRYIDLDPSLQLNPVWELNDGQKVKLIIIPEDENVD